jgi:hypothetical protein
VALVFGGSPLGATKMSRYCRDCEVSDVAEEMRPQPVTQSLEHSAFTALCCVIDVTANCYVCLGTNKLLCNLSFINSKVYYS